MLTKDQLLSMTKEELLALPENKYCTGCWGCMGCTNCTGCRYCMGCRDCTGCGDCWGCWNCEDCWNCIGLEGQMNQTNVAFGVQCTEREIEKLKEKMK